MHSLSDYAHLPMLLPAATDLQKRRITEMLSQLPTEVDVMKLITLAIVGPVNPGSGKGGAASGEGARSARRSSTVVYATAANSAPMRQSTMELPAGGGGGGAAADGGDTGVADSKAWKGLLARATSVKGGGSFANSKRA